MMYFELVPNKLYVAEVPRNGTRAFALAALPVYYPELAKNISDNCSEDYLPRTFKQLFPKTEKPKGEILILVRDPKERARSIAAVGYDAPAQSGFKYTKAFKFPEQLKEFCEAAGISDMQIVGQTHEKPVIGAEIPDGDIEMYESLRGEA
jgi:hypothetical protein